MKSFILFSTALAQGLEVQYPKIGGISPESTAIGLPEYVKYIFNFSLAIAGLVVFLILIYAGFRYLISAGNPVLQSDAKQSISAAIVGLIVLLSSYLILTTINPQLIILQFPEKISFDFIENIISPEVSPPDSFSYNEIPLGGLIGELFAPEKIDKINNNFQEIKNVSNKINEAVQELSNLIGDCACSNANADCLGDCGDGYCSGDPCASNQEINNKILEIKELLDPIVSTDPPDGFKYWQEEFEKDINYFKKTNEDLIYAESMIKACPDNLSNNGRGQELLTYNALPEYKNYMQSFYNVEQFNAIRPFEYISSKYNPFSQATFYCAESLALVELSPGDIPEISVPSEEINLPTNISCGNEIRIGEATDNAQKLANEILAELENINNNAKKEISDIEILLNISDPSDCIASNCSAECVFVDEACYEPCAPGEGIEEGQLCSYDCSYCEVLPCDINPNKSVCPGDYPKNDQINNLVNKINSSNSSINYSNNRLKDFLNENIEDNLKISNIISLLNINQAPLADCYNSAQIQESTSQGSSGVIWKELSNCSNALQSDYLKISQCYGPNYQEIDLMDNFFCCSSQI